MSGRTVSEYPKCKTCKHWILHRVCDNSALTRWEQPRNAGMFTDARDSIEKRFEPPGPSFGCLLHSDLIEVQP